MSTMPGVTALVLAVAAAVGAPVASSAASAAAPATAAGAETVPSVRPVSVIEGEEEGGTCSRVRRRLWVEGEGWVVRRITTCR